mgnify:FL=1
MENRRFHILIEQQIDIFIECCKKYLTTQNLKVWVIKNEIDSIVGIGDPDKLFHSKDFGFTIPYEMIISNHDNAFEEFVFKLNHFIKIANSSDKFKAFKK